MYHMHFSHDGQPEISPTSPAKELLDRGTQREAGRLFQRLVRVQLSNERLSPNAAISAHLTVSGMKPFYPKPLSFTS